MHSAIVPRGTKKTGLRRPMRMYQTACRSEDTGAEIQEFVPVDPRSNLMSELSLLSPASQPKVQCNQQDGPTSSPNRRAASNLRSRERSGCLLILEPFVPLQTDSVISRLLRDQASLLLRTRKHISSGLTQST